MTRVIVLGAKGRFGRAAVAAFANAGWSVTAFGRNWDTAPTDRVKRIEGNAKDAAALAKACQGQAIIVNAINPPYEKWAGELPDLTRSIIAAVRASGATVIIPGNVYNYGAGMPETFAENTAWAPTTRKGKLRVEMERSYRDAGVPTIVLRGGDFIEREKTGNWFDSYIAAKAHLGKTTYPGPLDQVHAWAYLPDMARAVVALAERRHRFAPFEEFLFEGYNLTGAELVELIAEATGRPQKVSRLPWPILRLIALFSPQVREVIEMRYLWEVPHGADGSKLRAAIPEFEPTPARDAIKAALVQQNAHSDGEALSFSVHSA